MSDIDEDNDEVGQAVPRINRGTKVVHTKYGTNLPGFFIGKFHSIRELTVASGNAYCGRFDQFRGNITIIKYIKHYRMYYIPTLTSVKHETEKTVQYVQSAVRCCVVRFGKFIR